MLKLDFSSNPSLRQVSTMLRRAWLLDPPLTHAELADRPTAQSCFRTMCEALGAELSSAQSDHATWLSTTQLRVAPDPVVTAEAASPDPRSAVSPWREEVYDVYRHVFFDLWRGLEATGAVDPIARYDADRGDAVSLVVLPLPGAEEAGGSKVDATAFRTDTFLYPVWVNARAEVVFSAGGIEHRWVEGEEATWINGIWVREGEDLVITTKVVGEGKDETGVAAVFVTGHCDEKGGSVSTGTSAPGD